jgi:hypothetical protein
MDELITNAQGHKIAWVREECFGPNQACKRASRKNRTIHLIPHHDDPRAHNAHLVPSTHHYATREEALEALEIAWNTAIMVDNAIDRDNAYKTGRAVLVMKNGKYV